MLRRPALLLLCLTWACSTPDTSPLAADTGTDAGAVPQDSGLPDAATDAGVDASLDAGSTDTGSGDTGPGDAGTDVSYSCAAVGTGYSDGFFTLESYGGKLYAGLFGYGHEAQSMLYSYPSWALTSPGLTGISESICDMKVFDGELYANTESSGDIFKSTDGNNWQQVYDGEEGSIGCGLEAFGGKLYAINYRNSANDHGKILRLDGNTWTTVFDSGAAALYLRELVAYQGRLYAFGTLNKQGQMLTSSDGIQWQQESVANRYFRGHVFNGYLWLGSTDFYAAGEVAIWRYDGRTFERKHAGTKRYFTDLKDLNGHLFASTSNGWKDDSGPSSLLVSKDQGESWSTVCTFAETAVWNMAVHNGALYLGTWDFGNRGHVYRVETSAQPPVDCGLISTNPAWEVCETGPQFCAGIFTDGAGCEAYCASVGLPCAASFGGEPGCMKEPGNVLSCGPPSGNNSDWCECGVRGQEPPPPPPPECAPTAGSLGVGQTYTQQVDAHTGDEDSTQPKTDAHDGNNGDRRRFRRNNVARAHNDYWYTSSYRSGGEPDPAGPQWVDYVPNFENLGVGCYQVVAQYRATASRATYAAQYRILNSGGGDVLHESVQQRGTGEYIDEPLGNHLMCPGSFVRIQDPGAQSITFNRMEFTYLGPTCP